MGRTMSFYDLSNALPQPGCAVCRLKAAATQRYLDSMLWESVNDPGLRHDIRQARGFCHEHAWESVAPGFSFLNEFIDSSNVVATMISSRALAPRMALATTAIAEFFAPFIFGVAVARTIGRDIVAPGTVSIAVIFAALMSR
jgi:hypothetical protein